MRIRLRGTRGSQAAPGPDTARYGGNTSCIEVDTGDPQTLLVLDGGTGVRRVAASVPSTLRRVDVLLSHLHMDHIQGLGFFAPLHQPGLEVHIWGPASTTMGLAPRLRRYLSPPLFPVRLRDLACDLHLHETPLARFEVPGAAVIADMVCHPGPTVGYRIERNGRVLTYLPDHEPRLGSYAFGEDVDWMSGAALARGADLLVHDAQYTAAEYADRVGWGHSTQRDAVRFAVACGVQRLLLFHWDPVHDDATIDAVVEDARCHAPTALQVLAAREDDVLEV